MRKAAEHQLNKCQDLSLPGLTVFINSQAYSVRDRFFVCTDTIARQYSAH